jgi:transposase
VKKPSTATPRMTIGMDLGDRISHACVLDTSTGDVLDRFAFVSTPTGFEKRLSSLPRCRVVLEVGSHSRWASRWLSSRGHEVLTANARQVRLIARSDRKTDRIDAEILGRLGRFDPKLLHPIEHRREKAQQDLEVIKARDVLVRSRTMAVNHVRGVLKAAGTRVEGATAETFAMKARGVVPEALRLALLPLLAEIARLTKAIRAYDRRIEMLCEEDYPSTKRLRQVKGVGPITSLAYVLTLDRPERFGKSRMVGPYLGLSPRVAQSGEIDPQLGITKAGNSMLRRLLVGSAQYILGPFGSDTSLRRVGKSLMARGGPNAKKRAVVAVARRLAVLLHRLWVSGEPYEPLRNAREVPQVA